CSVYNYIHRSKFNFFSSTFFRSSRDTSAIFRLSRCLYSMKCCIVYRVNNFDISYNFLLRHMDPITRKQKSHNIHTL
ncbi:hypothetical protein L9F63_019358, partial [Diploptera punctata]